MNPDARSSWRRRSNRLAGMFLAGSLTIVIAIPAALAATLTLSPDVGPPLSQVQANGGAFGARERITLTLDGASAGTAKTDPSGNFTKRIRIPRTSRPGDHTVLATGQTSGLTAEATFLVRTDWAQFHNDATHAGFNPVENVLNRQTATQLQEAWIGDMGPGDLGNLVAGSSPAVVGGVVYIGDTNGTFWAFDADGCGSDFCSALWSWHTDNGIFSSPAVANGVVYVGSADHKLYAFDADGCGSSTCAPLWTGETGQAILDSSPTVVNGVVYVGSFDKKLYAFDADGCGAPSCSALWTGATGSPIFANSPAVVSGVVYVAGQHKLAAFDADGCGAPTCSPLWSWPSVDFYGGSPAVANGNVYVGLEDTLAVFDADGCGAPTCAPLWVGTSSESAIVASSPAVANGVVYVGKNTGDVLVYDAAGCGASSCSPIRDLLVDDQVVSSSPAVVNGTVYIGSSNLGFNAWLYVFNMSGQ